jgi:hypothetical protein
MFANRPLEAVPGAASILAGQRIAHSIDEVCLANQVGDDGADVARSLESEECTGVTPFPPSVEREIEGPG